VEGRSLSVLLLYLDFLVLIVLYYVLLRLDLDGREHSILLNRFSLRLGFVLFRILRDVLVGEHLHLSVVGVLVLVRIYAASLRPPIEALILVAFVEAVAHFLVYGHL